MAKAKPETPTKKDDDRNLEIPVKEAQEWAKKGGVGNGNGANGSSKPPKK